VSGTMGLGLLTFRLGLLIFRRHHFLVSDSEGVEVQLTSTLLDLNLLLDRGDGVLGVQQLVKQGRQLVAGNFDHIRELCGNGTVLRGRCDGNTSHLNGLLWCHFRHEVALDTPPQILVCHILDTGDEGGLERLHTFGTVLTSDHHFVGVQVHVYNNKDLRICPVLLPGSSHGVLCRPFPSLRISHVHGLEFSFFHLTCGRDRAKSVNLTNASS
jgi:hypothetical protein